MLAVEALGPLTVLGGIVWALAQPYRVTFFYPDGKGLWDWLVQPPPSSCSSGSVLPRRGARAGRRSRQREREPGDAAPG